MVCLYCQLFPKVLRFARRPARVRDHDRLHDRQVPDEGRKGRHQSRSLRTGKTEIRNGQTCRNKPGKIFPINKLCISKASFKNSLFLSQITKVIFPLPCLSLILYHTHSSTHLHWLSSLKLPVNEYLILNLGRDLLGSTQGRLHEVLLVHRPHGWEGRTQAWAVPETEFGHLIRKQWHYPCGPGKTF